ncbi:MAG: pitrilysin family protein [Elusimicrobiota bacterium]|jgi:predicted Zn-dependent peptidase
MFIFSCLLSITFSQATPPPLPVFPPLEFHPPKPERFVLENGLVVFLLEDHELPLIKLHAVFRTGSQHEPADKVGLGAIFGEAMTHGGTLSRKPEDIEKTLDQKAASVGFGIGLEQGSASMQCRAGDFDEIFSIFVDLTLHPLFRKDFMELAKATQLEALRRINDAPGEVSRREFRRILYGANHPYARLPAPETIKKIGRSDLIAWHQRFFHPNTTILAISGDFQSSAMKEKLQKTFGDWPKAEVSLPTVPEVPATRGKQLFYINRPISQSQIRIGSLGLARHNPDHFAWEVFNELWGGSATSRLFRTVRTQMGLAYSVGSGYSEPALPGLIVAVSQTRNAETIKAVQAILQISKECRAAPFTPGDIQDAKEAIQNRFIENYTSSEQIVSEVMGFEYFGYPADYLDTYPGRIAAVTAADLARVGEKYLRPEDSTILIMGDLSLFNKPLSTLGKPQEVKPLDYSQGEP